MMSDRSSNPPTIAALIVYAAWLVTWAAGVLAGAAAWAVHVGLPALGMAVAAVGVVWLARRDRQQRAAAISYLDALGHLDPRNLRSDNTLGNVTPLPQHHPLHDAAEHLCKKWTEHCERIHDLEHSRTASEIRCRRVAAESEQINTIFAGLSEPILAVDRYGDLTLANHSAAELFNFNLADTPTRAAAQLVKCRKLVNLLTTTAQRTTCGSRSDEIEIPVEDGGSRWYRAVVTRLSRGEAADAEARPDSAGAVAVLHDVGEHKELQKRNAQFVSAASHEMKTPLAGIKAYVELLIDGDAEDEQTREEFLEVISSQADRLQRLVENLLNIARIEAGVVKVSKHQQSLNAILEESLNVVQPAAETKQIELLSDLSPLYLGVFADRDLLLQSAINLLSNAVKYTGSGGRVALRSRMDDHQVRFEVEDTGVGLSEEDSQRVFEKFYRVKKDKNMAAGTGLGLPLAKHIVEDVHGGRLSLQSTLGQGSTFCVSLPSAGSLD